MRLASLFASLFLIACVPTGDGGGATEGQLAAGGAPQHKYALVVGGPPPLQFGAWVAREVGALDRGGYHTAVLLSDGTDAENLPGGAPAAFSRENFLMALSGLVGAVSKGDEVLIAMATHGFACTGWTLPPGADPNIAGPEDFCIALGVPQPESGYAEFAFDALRPYLAKLDAAGVTTGLLVSTCDSGNALRVAGPRTCVISATGYDTSRRTVFFDSWIDHTTPSMTLRQAYHAALPYANDYEQCQQGCPDDMTKLCPGPCSYYDTPWISAERGYPDAPCDAFTL
jgi:hypothetical protein